MALSVPNTAESDFQRKPLTYAVEALTLNFQERQYRQPPGLSVQFL